MISLISHESGIIEIFTYPSLNKGKYLLKIYLSKSGAKGLGTELIRWSYHCNEGGHFHIEPMPYKHIYESMGVFCLPGSSEIIFESGFSNYETLINCDEDYDINSDNTIFAELVDLNDNIALHNRVQFSFNKNAMRDLGEFLCQNNIVNNLFAWEINKPYSENLDVCFISNEKSITAVEVIITENKCIDDFYK